VIEVKRRKGESSESLLRRFTRRVQQSGNLLEVRKLRFYAKAPNKTKQRDSALRRKEIREKRDYLLKTGRLVETETAPRRRG